MDNDSESTKKQNRNQQRELVTRNELVRPEGNSYGLRRRMLEEIEGNMQRNVRLFDQ